MKILLNLLAATTGGQITRARAFLDRIESVVRGVDLVVLKESAVLGEYGTTNGRQVVNVPIGQGRLKAVRRMAWENLAMTALIRKHAPDVYLTFSHYLPAVDLGIPSVVGVSNLAPFSAEAWANESALVKLKMTVLRRTIVSSAKRATRVLALSEACRDILIAHGIAQGRIAVTPNGVDAYWSEPCQGAGVLERLGIAKRYLLYVSHFHRYKNHLRLVEAFDALPDAIRDEHQLVLAGKPDNKPYFDEVANSIARKGLERHVLLIPGEGAGALRVLYQKASLFVFPSLIENSPNILLEAMMAGAPIATCGLAPMPEYCQSAAVYFDGLSPSNMSETLSDLLRKPAMLEELRGRARERARKYSWDEFVRQVAEQVDAALCRRVDSPTD